MNERSYKWPVGPAMLFLLAVTYVLRAPVVFGQETGPSQPANVGPSVCAPVQSDQYDGLAPMLADSTSGPAIAGRLAGAYRQIARSGNTDSARETLQQLRNDAAATGDVCVQALATFGLGEATPADKPEEGAEYFQQAKAMFHNIHSLRGEARAEFRLGTMLRLQKRYPQALAEYAQAEELFEQAGDAEAALRAKVAAQGAEREPNYAPLVARAHDLHLVCAQADIEEKWANRFWHSDHFAEAGEHYQASDALYAQCPGKKSARAALQTEMGRMERQQGRPEAAQTHYRLALALQLQSGDTSLVPQTYNAMAVAYEAMNDYPRAIARYRQGLDYARRIHAQPFIEFIEANLAATYSRNHQPRLALPLLQRLSENVTGNHLRCVRLGQLGTVYSHLLQDERAIETILKSKEACQAEDENERIVQNDVTLSASELRLHRYDDALRDARQGVSLLEDARAHLVTTDAHKQGFTSTVLARDLYSNAIAALTALHRGNEAFELAEQARARAFLDLLASHGTAPGAAAGPRLLAQFRKDLIDSPVHAAPLTAEAMLAETARLHSTLLAYWVADDCVYIWTAQPGGHIVEVRQPIALDHLTKLVSETHSSTHNSTAPSSAWHALYRLLIAPVEPQLPPDNGALLTIVPGGPLFALSFAALQGNDRRYLVERFRLHTTPSISLLAYTRRNAERNTASSAHYLVVASPSHLPTASDGHALQPLPGATLEADAIVHTLPAGTVTELSGHEASLKPLTAALPAATAVHFATHAVLNDADPYASYLALDDTNHDGRLTVAQIYTLPLHSRLVVLSACSSGLGRITGDGVAGMGRAFFYAGAASVMTTMWDIADRPTAEMQPRFYAALASGQSPSAALRTAQLSTLHDLRRNRIKIETLSGARESLPEDPLYWASFSLSGQP